MKNIPKLPRNEYEVPKHPTPAPPTQKRNPKNKIGYGKSTIK